MTGALVEGRAPFGNYMARFASRESSADQLDLATLHRLIESGRFNARCTVKTVLNPALRAQSLAFQLKLHL